MGSDVLYLFLPFCRRLLYCNWFVNPLCSCFSIAYFDRSVVFSSFKKRFNVFKFGSVGSDHCFNFINRIFDCRIRKIFLRREIEKQQRTIIIKELDLKTKTNEELYLHIYNKQERIEAVPSSDVIVGWALNLLNLLYPERLTNQQYSLQEIRNLFHKLE